MIDRIYNETRALIRGSAVELPNTDWLQDIKLLIAQQIRRGAFTIQYYIDLDANEIPIKVGKQLAIFTNVLLENIEKHSNAKNASLNIMRENGSIFMFIEDDGKGFDPDNIQRIDGSSNFGLGLKHIKHRVEDVLHGYFDVDSKPDGRGAVITIQIPFDQS